MNILISKIFGVVIAILFASCTNMKDVSNHSVYAPYVGKEVTTLKGYNLFKVDDADRHVFFADYQITSGNWGGETRLKRLPAGTRLKISRFKHVRLGGVYKILALGTLLYDGKEIEFEQAVRMETHAIDPNEYPVPYAVVGP